MTKSSNQATTNETPKVGKDLYQQVTDTIISHLEAGTAPWHKPWKGGDSIPFRLPKNYTTGKHYQGVNILLLWAASMDKEYSLNEWASFKQWSSKKESIRKGEKGTLITYYDTFEKEVEGEIKSIPFLKCSVVFNRSQLASYETEKETAWEPCPLPEMVEKADTFIANTKVAVKETGYKACYVPSIDEIYMPTKNSFINTEELTSTEAWYATLCHELVHATGHEKRLNRKFGKRFGDNSYAFEELVAEMGAAFLCASLEITNTPKKEHANYISHWLNILKQDKQAIFTAASAASKAVEYLKTIQPQVQLQEKAEANLAHSFTGMQHPKPQ
jgi:antirestriction protein ArdC